MSVAEEGFDPDRGDTNKLDKINDFLAEYGKDGLSFLTSHVLGGKHPQTLTFGGGYNGFPEDEFVELLTSFDWRRPDCVALAVQTEHYPLRIWRPIVATSISQG